MYAFYNIVPITRDTTYLSYTTSTCAIYYIVPVTRGHDLLVLYNFYLCHILHCSSHTWTRPTCLMQLLLVPYTTLFQSHVDTTYLSYTTSTCAIYYIVPVTRDTTYLSYTTSTCAIYYIVPVTRGHDLLVLYNFYLCHILHCSSHTWTRPTCLIQLLLVPYTTLFQSHVDTTYLSYATSTCAIYYIVPVTRGHDLLVLCNFYLCHILHCSSHTWTRPTCLMQLLLVPYTTLFQSHVDTTYLSYTTSTCAIYYIVPVTRGHDLLVLCNFYLCHILHCSSHTWTRPTCLIQLLLVPYTTLFQSHVTRPTCLMQLLLVPYTTLFQSHVDTTYLSYTTSTCAIYYIVPVTRGHDLLVLCNFYLCHILHCSSHTWTRPTCLIQLCFMQ